MVYQDDLLRGLEEFRELANRALRTLWEQQKFRKGPLFLPQEDSTRRVIMTRSHALKGWGVAYCVFREEFPELGAKQSELDQVRLTRKRDVESWIAGLH